MISFCRLRKYVRQLWERLRREAAGSVLENAREMKKLARECKA